MANRSTFFSEEVVEMVRGVLTVHCGDGSCITYNALAEACGFSVEKDIPLLREIINHEFKGENDGDIEVVKGPDGGLGFRGMKRPERPKAADTSMAPEWLARVESKLNEVLTGDRKGVSAEMLAGLLGEHESQLVRKAVLQLDGFEMAKGVGIRRVAAPVAQATGT